MWHILNSRQSNLNHTVYEHECTYVQNVVLISTNDATKSKMEGKCMEREGKREKKVCK